MGERRDSYYLQKSAINHLEEMAKLENHILQLAM